jgi:hypothetical protein
MANGWCDNAAHGGYDHEYRPQTCIGFQSEAEFDAQMQREADEHDRPSSHDAAAAYVAQHRPY